MATVAEFRTAKDNLKKLRTYFQARSLWRVPDGSAGALAAIGRHARAIAERLRDAGYTVGFREHSRPEPLPPHDLDVRKLEQFAAYLERLAGWFDSVDLTVAGSAASEALTEAEWLAGAIAELSGREKGPGPAKKDDEMEVRAIESATVPDIDPVVLDPSGGEPLLAEIREGRFELAPAVRERLAAFLGAAGLELNAAERRRFEREVCRWIEAIPPRQILVIKLSGLSGAVRPYPIYRPVGEEGAEAGTV